MPARRMFQSTLLHEERLGVGELDAIRQELFQSTLLHEERQRHMQSLTQLGLRGAKSRTYF
ncbi:hypothetical protein PA598K_04527 [Paenibacillus sp. 598K]|nr:hypothetical protein PA598K_04527 [Paenibacillus sp. 598K]